MSDTEITFCGKALPLNTEEGIDSLISYLQARKTEIQARNTLLNFVTQSNPSDDKPLEPNSISGTTTAVSHKEIIEQINKPLHLIDWFEQAWDALGHPEKGATGDEFFDIMLKLGFEPSANNPKAAIKTSIRINPRFRKIGITENNAALWKLIPRSVKLTSPFTTEAKEIMDKIPRYKGAVKMPSPGGRVIDYVMKAIALSNDGVTTEQLVQRMKDQGWETEGHPVNTVNSTMSKARYRDMFIRRDGLWFINKDATQPLINFVTEGEQIN